MTDLPAPLGDPLHILQPRPWLTIWMAVLVALLALWLLWRWYGHRGSAALQPEPAPEAAMSDFAAAVKAVQRRAGKSTFFRLGCHELAALLRGRLVARRGEALAHLTAREIAARLSGDDYAQLLVEVSSARFARRIPDAGTLDALCELALELETRGEVVTVTLEFARPWVFFALALLPFYAWRRIVLGRRDRVPYAPLRWATSGGWRRRAGHVLLAVELLLLAGTVGALAGPFRESTTERVDDAGIDLALVLDVSLSMLAEDFEPNRITALRRIARDFLTRRSADRVALVIFANDTYVQSPLTTDDAVLLELLSAVTVDTVDQYLSGGTAIGDALLLASDQLIQARVEGRDQSVILITDGESNQGIDPGVAARYLGEQEIQFHAIGVGGDEPMPIYREGRRIGDGLLTRLDEAGLMAMAETGGGNYYRAADTLALERVFADLARLASSPLEATTVTRRRSLVPLGALLVLVLFTAYVGLEAGLVRRPLR